MRTHKHVVSIMQSIVSNMCMDQNNEDRFNSNGHQPESNWNYFSMVLTSTHICNDYLYMTEANDVSAHVCNEFVLW